MQHLTRFPDIFAKNRIQVSAPCTYGSEDGGIRKQFIVIYECEDCSDCPHRDKCTKSKDWNRRIEVNVRLEELKQEARRNLMSEVGIALRKRRCIAGSNGVGVSSDSS